MVLHFPKTSIKNAVKRSCALIAALCIALYSLITAPLFGVHAVDSGKLTSLISDCLSSVATALGGAVGGLPAAIVTGFASPVFTYVSDPSDDAPLVLPRTIPNYAFSGYYTNNGSPKTISFYAYSGNYSSLPTTAYGVRISNFIVTPDYTVSFYAYPDAEWSASVSSSERALKLYLFPSIYSDAVDIYPTGSIISPSGTTPYFHIQYQFSFTNGSYFAWTSPTLTSLTELERYKFRLIGNSYNFPSDLQSYVTSQFLNGSSQPVYCVLGYFFNNVNYASSIPTTNSTLLSDSLAIDYYNNQVRNYIISNYSEYPEITNTYVTYNDYTYIEPTDPTEPNTGTTGGVIIIDPFTLPPEWLEDNAELGTSHYELDSEQWEDPLEIIKKYKHADPSGEIPTGVVNDDGSFEGPADVVEAMEAFTDYAYMILTESGLLWVVASLVSVGLVVRLFTLK